MSANENALRPGRFPEHDRQSRRRRQWSEPIEGGPPVQLTSFKSDSIFAFDWSRDGKQLVLARGTVTPDAVLISNLK